MFTPHGCSVDVGDLKGSVRVSITKLLCTKGCVRGKFRRVSSERRCIIVPLNLKKNNYLISDE